MHKYAIMVKFLHYHTLSYINKSNHTFCNILIHYNTKMNNTSSMSLPPSCRFHMDVLYISMDVLYISMFLPNSQFKIHPLSCQDRISPYTISTISSRQVMRIKRNINKEIIGGSNSKFS